MVEGKFPTDYQRWRRKAIREGYPRCKDCNEPIQVEYQRKGDGTLCRRCTVIQEVNAYNKEWPSTGADPIAYEQGRRS